MERVMEQLSNIKDEFPEYRIKVSVRNNLLLTAIENGGYKTLTKFAEAVGAHKTAIGSLVSLRTPPINMDGEFTELAKKVMETLGAAPTDLWTVEQLTMKLKRNTGSFNTGIFGIQSILGSTEVRTLGFADPEPPDEHVEKEELKDAILKILNRLTPRQKIVICERYGIGQDPLTLEECAEKHNVTKERIRQIEAHAIRLLRHPKFRSALTKTGFISDEYDVWKFYELTEGNEDEKQD